MITDEQIKKYMWPHIQWVKRGSGKSYCSSWKEKGYKHGQEVEGPSVITIENGIPKVSISKGVFRHIETDCFEADFTKDAVMRIKEWEKTNIL